MCELMANVLGIAAWESMTIFLHLTDILYWRPGWRVESEQSGGSSYRCDDIRRANAAATHRRRAERASDGWYPRSFGKRAVAGSPLLCPTTTLARDQMQAAARNTTQRSRCVCAVR